MVLAINVRLFSKPPGTTTPYEVKTTPVHVCVRRYMDVRENATERNARMALTKKNEWYLSPVGASVSTQTSSYGHNEAFGPATVSANIRLWNILKFRNSTVHSVFADLTPESDLRALHNLVTRVFDAAASLYPRNTRIHTHRVYNRYGFSVCIFVFHSRRTCCRAPR